MSEETLILREAAELAYPEITDWKVVSVGRSDRPPHEEHFIVWSDSKKHNFLPRIDFTDAWNLQIALEKKGFLFGYFEKGHEFMGGQFGAMEFFEKSKYRLLLKCVEKLSLEAMK